MSSGTSHKALIELVREVADAVRDYGSANDALDAVASERLGVNRTDMRVLDILERRGPITPGEIAQRTLLTTGAITAVVDRLQKKGFVRRRADKQDRRKVLVEVTPKLRKRTQEIYSPLAEEGYRQMQKYSARELELIRDVLLQGRDLLVRRAREL